MYHAVIMSGGAGTRLWPLTRQSMPKQFLALGTDRPLIAETAARLERTVPPERIWVVTGRRYESLVREALPQLPRENVICEPVARNSAGAVGLAMARLLRRDPDAVFSVLPSDHLMTNLEQFDAALALSAAQAEAGAAVCIGVTPRYAETGYGYVERAGKLQARDGVVAFAVERFVEKPDAERAAAYVRAGTFLWNAGIFTWHAARLRELFDRHLPGANPRFEATDRLTDVDHDAALGEFSQLPNVSIDYALAEKETNVVVEADLGWIDIGGWDALYSATPGKDASANVASEQSILVDVRGCHVQASPGKLVAAIGVEDLVVVDTDDALLICRRDRTQDVRRVVDEAKRRGLESYL